MNYTTYRNTINQMARALRKIKKSLWLLTAPIWPITRMCMGKWRIVWREQDKDKKHIGYLKPGKTVKEFHAFMRSRGFKRHYMAYKDIDELFSMRKLHQETHQYHLRFYRNRQITGHYELAPETSTIKHLREIGLEFRKEDFLEIMGEWVVE